MSHRTRTAEFALDDYPQVAVVAPSSAVAATYNTLTCITIPTPIATLASLASASNKGIVMEVFSFQIQVDKAFGIERTGATNEWWEGQALWELDTRQLASNGSQQADFDRALIASPTQIGIVNRKFVIAKSANNTDIDSPVYYDDDRVWSINLEDNSGRGVLVATPTITIHCWHRAWTGGYPVSAGGAHDFANYFIAARITYRLVEIALPEYLGILQSQQASQRLS